MILTSKYLTEAKEYYYSTVNDFFQKAALEYATQSAVSLRDKRKAGWMVLDEATRKPELVAMLLPAQSSGGGGAGGGKRMGVIGTKFTCSYHLGRG